MKLIDKIFKIERCPICYSKLVKMDGHGDCYDYTFKGCPKCLKNDWKNVK